MGGPEGSRERTMATGRKTGGRRKGSLNKASAAIKAAFQKHGDELVKALLVLTKDEDPRVRLGAITAAMDRGWGRPAQAHTGEGGEGPVTVVGHTGIER